MIYMFGQPGAGKTTAIVELCKLLGGSLLYEANSPIKHRGSSSPIGMFSLLGGNAFPFGGTDTLSYTCVQTSPLWLKKLSECSAGKLVIGEGDRLSNSAFFLNARKYYDLQLFYLECKPGLAEERRERRAKDNNLKLQNQSWVAGRKTKNKNLADKEKPCYIDASLSSMEIAVKMLSLLNIT